MYMLLMNRTDSYQVAPASMTLMTYRFVSQPASSTSNAHYTRRLTDRRSRVTVESDRGLHGCLVTIGNACSFSRAGIPHLGTPERRNLAGKASLKIRWPMPKTGWHVMITLHYSNDFPRRSWLSAMPAPVTASLGRLQMQGNGEGRQGRMGWGRTYIL